MSNRYYDLSPEEMAELERLVVREAQHSNDCRVWVNDKGNMERCTCWKVKAFRLLGVELNE